MDTASLSAAWVGVRSVTLSPRVLTRVTVAVLLGLIGFATLTALGAYQLSFSAPEWWRTVDAQNASTIALAEQTENGITSAVHRRRPLGEPWTVALTAAQANAWMNVMLPRWLENQEVERPAWASELQLQFDSGWIGAGVQALDEHGRDRYVTLRAAPVVDPEGALWLLPVGASIGRLSVPLRWTFEELERRVKDDNPEIAEILAGQRPVIDSAVLELGDGRVVRVVEVRADDGKLLITCETLR